MNVVLPREPRKLINTIRPIIFAAEQTHQNKPRLGGGFLDQEVNGEGMLQGFEIGRAQRRQFLLTCVPSRDEARQITIGERQKHNLRWRQIEIDGFRRLIKRYGL